MNTVERLCAPLFEAGVKALALDEMQNFLKLNDDEMNELAIARVNKHTFLERIFATPMLGSINFSSYFNKVRDLLLKTKVNGLYDNSEYMQEDAKSLTCIFLSHKHPIIDLFNATASDIGLGRLFTSEEGKDNYLHEAKRSEFQARKKRCLACGFESVKNLKYEAVSVKNKSIASSSATQREKPHSGVSDIGMLGSQNRKRFASTALPQLPEEPQLKVARKEGSDVATAVTNAPNKP